MISFVAREVGIEDESPLLLVGISESTDDDGQDFFFQCDLRRNDYPEVSNWPEGESYSVSEQGGRSAYGCVREVWFQGNLLRFTLSARGASALALDDVSYEIRIEDPRADLPEVRRYLRRIVTCGRPEFHPTSVEIEDSDASTD
ncbi:MAG: hypothetical protein QOE51_2741 [Actinoplanes sp.]|jgi:hypothetical protein|nr:hypothetical protein [Actinoplanes sp.]